MAWRCGGFNPSEAKRPAFLPAAPLAEYDGSFITALHAEACCSLSFPISFFNFVNGSFVLSAGIVVLSLLLLLERRAD